MLGDRALPTLMTHENHAHNRAEGRGIENSAADREGFLASFAFFQDIDPVCASSNKTGWAASVLRESWARAARNTNSLNH